MFSYYKDEDDESKDKALKKFIIEDSNIIDYPTGTDNYTYVIKIILGPLYNDREILLCFEEKSDHQSWLKVFDTNMKSDRVDSLVPQTLQTPAQNYDSEYDHYMEEFGDFVEEDCSNSNSAEFWVDVQALMYE